MKVEIEVRDKQDIQQKEDVQEISRGGAGRITEEGGSSLRPWVIKREGRSYASPSSSMSPG